MMLNLEYTLEKLRSGGVKSSFIINSMKVFYLIFSMASVMSSSSMPHISEDRDDTGVPVACSKCNETFKTDSDYVVHYNEMHSER